MLWPFTCLSLRCARKHAHTFWMQGVTSHDISTCIRSANANMAVDSWPGNLCIIDQYGDLSYIVLEAPFNPCSGLRMTSHWMFCKGHPVIFNIAWYHYHKKMWRISIQACNIFLEKLWKIKIGIHLCAHPVSRGLNRLLANIGIGVIVL